MPYYLNLILIRKKNKLIKEDTRENEKQKQKNETKMRRTGKEWKQIKYKKGK